MDTPRLTVVTPSYNQGDFIERTLDSVLSQGYPNLEYIIIDGGSKDNSVEVIKRYEKFLSYWVSEPDRGQSHAINKGFGRATGDLMAWLNSDDWYVNDALRIFADTYQSQPDCGMIAGAGTIVDANGQVTFQCGPTGQITLDSLYGWVRGGLFMQPSSAISRGAWTACGPIDETEHLSMDVDYWIRVAKAGFTFVSRSEHISESLAHPKAKTTEFAEQSIMSCARVIAKHGSMQGYEDAMSVLANRTAGVRKALNWYRTNYELVTSHPLVRLARPLAKRFGTEGSYWPERVPPWVQG